MRLLPPGRSIFCRTMLPAALLLASAPAGVPLSKMSVAEPPVFRPIDTSPLMGSPDPMPLEPERVFPGLSLDRPLELTFAPDGSDRVFVVEQEGLIHVFPNRNDVAKTEIFLDIREVVSREGNEEGLLGLAFHPDYAKNGQFYVYYSTRPRASIVSRFQVSADNPNRADRRSQQQVMKIDQPYSNHNGGCIRFGPDGYLYIGLGDGGSAHDPHGNGQNLGTLLGSILRIDVDRADPGKNYAVPKNNPFVGREGACGEIWAYGIRNIWRMSFDRQTGQLWAGDVGQNRYEEVNLIRRGGNYGWKIREGFHPFEPDAPQTGGPLIEPLAEYFHSEGLSITGGGIYRGTRLSRYQGAYFYGDYVSGQVWIVRHDGSRVTENRKVAQTGLAISAFGEDAEGEMILTAFDGSLYRLRERPVDLDAIRAAFPKRLSETGLFASTENLQLQPGALPYSVNVPLWSDHAAKGRFIVLPAGAKIGFEERASWRFPVGTVLVKHFFLDLDRQQDSPLRRLETRFFVHSPEGWRGYTYLWNDAETDAELLDEAVTRTYQVKTAEGTIEQRWYFPSRADCMACHTRATDFVLGPNTRQMNLQEDYGSQSANQIDMLAGLGAFETPPAKPVGQLEKYPDWEADSEPIGALVRAYLDVNCSFCHSPDGIGGKRPDLRFHTPLQEMAVIDRPPNQGQLGPEGSALVTPGVPEKSEILHRVSMRGSRQMPPLATFVADETAIERLTQWIRQQKDPERKRQE
ncbi:MAG: PQQ-dependent sugar dehydrogenase [Thermoguttaceae bacterium]